MKIKLMLIDNHQMFCDLLRAYFSLEPDIEVLGVAAQGRDALAILEKTVPDVLIIEVDLNDIGGIEVARIVKKLYPSIRILALSGHTEVIYIKDMLEAGALGYVLKSSGIDTLVSAIRKVARGGTFLSPETAKALEHWTQSEDGAYPRSSALAKREKEVLCLLCEGTPSALIAQTLGIAEGTVETHRRNIRRKLGLYSTAELTRYAIRTGLISS